MIKILIGGSPCTNWSIAQKNNRETTPSGIGWELFKNFLIAKEKFKPDYFLYENNKSAAKPIKDQIAHELGVDLMYINSSLVSAQNRQRFYAFNWNVEQPQDRKILLKDILESGYAVGETKNKSYVLSANYSNGSGAKIGNYASHTLEKGCKTMVAEPVRVGDFPNNQGHISGSQATILYSIDGKSVNLVGNGVGQGAKTGLYPIPSIGIGYRSRKDKNGINRKRFESNNIEKANALTTVQTDSMVAYKNERGQPIYEVKNGIIVIKERCYPIKLQDGFYTIRKLTVTECERLQTLPDKYCKSVSNTQAYRGLGNGWTAEVIIHILNGILCDVPRDEKIIVLSMYDGIGTGRYCFNNMGFTNIEYHAYEIDKYAIQIALDNYSDIIQHGDAFDLRETYWKI